MKWIGDISKIVIGHDYRCRRIIFNQLGELRMRMLLGFFICLVGLGDCSYAQPKAHAAIVVDAQAIGEVRPGDEASFVFGKRVVQVPHLSPTELRGAVARKLKQSKVVARSGRGLVVTANSLYVRSPEREFDDWDGWIVHDLFGSFQFEPFMMTQEFWRELSYQYFFERDRNLDLPREELCRLFSLEPCIEEAEQEEDRASASCEWSDSIPWIGAILSSRCKAGVIADRGKRKLACHKAHNECLRLPH
jgi:hypothetical protein